MSNFTFKLPNGESFEIKMPSGATFEQAQAIFKQQVDSGGLTGFKVGDALSAATQAADGLAAASSQLSQGIASSAGTLPVGTNLNSLTAGIGPAAAGAANQLTSALTGSIPSVASLTTGSSAGINSAISGLSSNLPATISGLTSKLPAATGALTGQAAQIGSIANNAVKTISGAITGTPLNGINVADFAKQGPSLGPMSSLTSADVTGTLAQASKLVGQATGALSNSLGVGKFGLDAGQLEKAGFLKPGTAAEFLAGGESDLTAVLKSPLPWTGKDGVKGVGDLLGNGKLQDKIQQELMSSGLKDLKQLGVPTDIMKPQALAGLATNAAKSVESTLAWAKNSPDLPADVKAKFDATAVNSAFAVKLTEGKVEPALKQEEPAPAAVGTVDTDTLDAALQRILGNDKIPVLLISGAESASATIVKDYTSFLTEIDVGLKVINNKISQLTQRSFITQEDWNTINQEFQVVQATFNARYVDIEAAAEKAVALLPSNSQVAQIFEEAAKLVDPIANEFADLKKLLQELTSKIRATRTI